MLLPKSLVRVTPFSQMLVIVLFVLFILWGVLIGRAVQLHVVDEGVLPQPTQAPVAMFDTPESLSERCGAIPSEELKIDRSKFMVVDGPAWAPDCRHIAWSVWESGTGWLGEGVENGNTRPPSRKTGIYMYTDATKSVKKVFGSAEEETVTFVEWLDKDTISFVADEKSLRLDVPTGKVSQE